MSMMKMNKNTKLTLPRKFNLGVTRVTTFDLARVVAPQKQEEKKNETKLKDEVEEEEQKNVKDEDADDEPILNTEQKERKRKGLEMLADFKEEQFLDGRRRDWMLGIGPKAD